MFISDSVIFIAFIPLKAENASNSQNIPMTHPWYWFQNILYANWRYKEYWVHLKSSV
jgi:hypothetical protein